MVASPERTLAIIKPHAVAAGYAPGIEALIERNSFAVLARMELTLSSEQVAELYEDFENDPDFFTALTAEMTSGPIIALALEKANGVASWLELLGSADEPMSVRGVFGSSPIKDAAHGSTSAAAAFRELKLFFPRVFPRETSIAIIMPSAVASTDAIVSAVATDGFLITAKASVQLSKEQAESFFADSPLLDEMVAKITAGPLTVLACEKPFAVEGLTALAGPPDGASPGTLRNKFGEMLVSESLSAAAKEAAFFFGAELTTPTETFAWIKPDAFEQADAILAEAEAAGFTIIASEVHTLSQAKAGEFYAEHEGREYYAPLVDFMTSGPALALVLSRPCAVTAWRSLCGPTNTADAKAKFPYCLRAKYGTDGRRNATHGSDSATSVAREAGLIFPSLYKTESTLAILLPDATPHMETILATIAAAGLSITDRCFTTLAPHRAQDLLRVLGSETPPPAPPLPPPDLFISAWMEGGKCNKFLQLYNPGANDVSLDGYALPMQRGKGQGASSSWPIHLFPPGKIVPAGGVFVVYHPKCTEAIKKALPPDDRCSWAHEELSNGNDAMALVKMLPGAAPQVVDGLPPPYTVVDMMGDFDAARGVKPWPVAGVVAASKDKTLVRKPTVTAGNPESWDMAYNSSQGTTAASSEWVVLKKDTTAAAELGWSLSTWLSTPPPPAPPPAGSFEACVAHLTSAPSMVLALSGKGAIARWNALLGPVDPTIAKVRCPGCLRAKFGVDATCNVGLGSLSAAAAFQELKFFFPKALVDPVPSGKQAKDYVTQALTPTLTAGLVELCRTKPSNPVEWLAKWLIANNPNAPLTMD